MTKEVWKKIPGIPGYEASSLGRIRTVSRFIKCRNRWGTITKFLKRGIIRKPYLCKDGYYRLPLRVKGKYAKEVLPHRMVALAFYGIPKGKVVNHINGIKSDNRLCNLEICTTQQNKDHAVKTRLIKYKLSNEDVRVIRFFNIKNAGTSRILAKIFNVHILTIQRISSGFSYLHVT